MKIRSILFLLLILIFSSCSGRKDYLPGAIFDLALKEKLTGEPAKNFVNKLHFQKVTDEQNIIGFYEGDKGKVMIYVTIYDNELDARENYNKMTAKISPDNSVFYNSDLSSIGDIEIYSCFGMGQKHFIFVQDKDLFWISAETGWADQFLAAYLNYIK